MTQDPIFTAFKSIWAEIEQVYNSGTICSERHLQAELYHLVKGILRVQDYQLFIEPKINTNSTTSDIHGLIPDMLVTRGKEIVAVIEIKYVPHGYAEYEKDFATFNKFQANAGKKDVRIDLLTDPYTGSWKDSENPTFTIANDLELLFIVIANKYSYCIDKPEVLKELLADKTAKVNMLMGSISGEKEPKKIEFTSLKLL